jgi:hypothetical protein
MPPMHLKLPTGLSQERKASFYRRPSKMHYAALITAIAVAGLSTGLKAHGSGLAADCCHHDRKMAVGIVIVVMGERSRLHSLRLAVS